MNTLDTFESSLMPRPHAPSSHNKMGSGVTSSNPWAEAWNDQWNRKVAFIGLMWKRSQVLQSYLSKWYSGTPLFQTSEMWTSHFNRHFVHNTSSMEVIMVMWHSVYKNSLLSRRQSLKLMIYGSLHGPGQIYEWRIILLLMNPWLILLSGVVACSDKSCKQVADWYRDAVSLCFPHCEMDIVPTVSSVPLPTQSAMKTK